MKKIYILCLCIFTIDSFAKDVGLAWYDNGTTISGATSCTLGGTFTPPTPSAKTGYIFAGWRVKEIHEPPATNCGIPSLNKNTNHSGMYGNTRLSGDAGYNEATYGLTTGSGQWAVRFSYGVVYGMANCNNTNGTKNYAGTPTLASSGQYCWCQATGFTPTSSSYTSGPQCEVYPVSSKWVFSYKWNSASMCASYCASGCSGVDSDMGTSTFRGNIYSVAGQ